MEKGEGPREVLLGDKNAATSGKAEIRDFPGLLTGSRWTLKAVVGWKVVERLLVDRKSVEVMFGACQMMGRAVERTQCVSCLASNSCGLCHHCALREGPGA